MLIVKQIWTCHMEFSLYKFIIISYHITEELLNIGVWPLTVHGKRNGYGAWEEHKESLAWNKEKQVYGTDDPGICWGGSRILLRGGGCHLPTVFAFLWAAHGGGGRGFITFPSTLPRSASDMYVRGSRTISKVWIKEKILSCCKKVRGNTFIFIWTDIFAVGKWNLIGSANRM